jgi:polyhydroxybutyrate depolymerase
MKFKFNILFWAFTATAFSFMKAGAQVSGSISFGGQNRSFVLYYPSSAAAGSSLPVVFVLHGFTQTAENIRGITGFNNIAETGPFIAVYAQGIGNAWNTNNPFPGGSTADDAGFIAALADTVVSRYNANPSRIYSCGFSAGGFMSHKLGCERSDKFAAIAAVSGAMTTDARNLCNPQRPVPVLQIHGTADAVVSYGGAFTNISVDDLMTVWTGKNQCPATPVVNPLPDIQQEGSTVEQRIYAPCDAGSEVQLLRVINGGHSWPSGSGLNGVGNTNRDINASQLIWDFFNRFSLSGPSSITASDQTNQMNVFPIPGKDRFIISKEEEMWSGNAELYSIEGRLIKSFDVENGELLLNQMQAGQYLLRIENRFYRLPVIP